MAELRTITCDRCGKIKEKTNHWWHIYANVDKRSMFITPMENIPEEPKGSLGLNACGLECLGILESKIKDGVNPLK